MAKSPPAKTTASLQEEPSGEFQSADPTTQDQRVAALEQQIRDLHDRIALGSSQLSDDIRPVEKQNERLAELAAVVSALSSKIDMVQANNSRDARFDAALRGVEAATAAVRGAGVPAATLCSEQSAKRDCDCGPCNCVSCECCTFEVWMSHVRVDQMQNPLIDIIPPSADSNLLPTGLMEIWMFASLDPIHNIGVCIPDPSPLSFLPLHKQMTDPYGPWVAVNRCVGTVAVKKGQPLTVPLSLTAVERETAEERVQPINRDEWGSASENVTFDCCYSNYSPIQVSVALSNWGQGGGAITGKFIVVRRC